MRCRRLGDLAAASAVSLATVKRLEAMGGVLIAHASTVTALRRALEAAGIEFMNGNQPGVRLRRKAQEPLRKRNFPKKVSSSEFKSADLLPCFWIDHLLENSSLAAWAADQFD